MNKLFAVASVTALSGLVSMLVVAGCADEPSPATGDPPDSGADVKPDRPILQDDPDADPPPETCLAKERIDATKFAYNPAVNSAGACTAEEAKALSDYFAAKVDANQAVAISEWAKEVSTKCGECVFSDGTGTKWPPILVKDDKLLAVNRGGCIELKIGKTECGEAYQQVTDCRFEACSKCDSDTTYTACIKDAQAIFTGSGPCKDAYAKMTTACGNALQAAETACQGEDWTFEGPIQTQCVTGGTGDGDAGDGDAGDGG